MTDKTGSEFENAAAHNNKNISDYTEQDALDAYERHDLWSGDLDWAAGEVRRAGNPEVSEAFKDLAIHLLSGENRAPNGQGFSRRSSVGLAVTDALNQADIGRFSRMGDVNSSFEGDPMGMALTKVLKLAIKSYLLENDQKPFDGYDPNSRRLTLKEGQTL